MLIDDIKMMVLKTDYLFYSDDCHTSAEPGPVFFPTTANQPSPETAILKRMERIHLQLYSVLDLTTETANKHVN